MVDGHVQEYTNIEPVSALAELLRTCICPQTLLLRVEHVIHQQFEKSQDDDGSDYGEEEVVKTFFKLFLTDGNLLIQALLHRKLQLEETEFNLKVGDLLEIHSYKVKRARRINADGHIIYLGIDGYHIVENPTKQQVLQVQTSRSTRGIKRRRSPTPYETNINAKYEGENAGGFVRDEDQITKPSQKRRAMVTDEAERRISPDQDLEKKSSPKVQGYGELAQNRNTISTTANGKGISKKSQKEVDTQVRSRQETNRHKRLYEESSEEDAFQSVTVNTKIANKRRRTLHNLDQNALTSDRQLSPFDGEQITVNHSISKTRATSSNIIPPSEQDDTRYPIESSSVPKAPSVLIKESSLIQPNAIDDRMNSSSAPQTTSEAQSPFHTLASLTFPSSTSRIPRKSYALTTLAIITWINPSLISRPNSPFPPKRHLKIEDPSLYNTNTTNNAAIPLSSHRATTGNNTSQPLGSQKRNRGVTLAVYDQAATFKPKVGTLALFRGVVMQRLWNGECILNVYPRRKPDKRDTVVGSLRARQISLQASKLDSSNHHNKQGRNHHHENAQQNSQPDQSAAAALQSQNDTSMEGEWFITDQQRLKELGYDVDGILKWWDERQKELLGRK